MSVLRLLFMLSSVLIIDRASAAELEKFPDFRLGLRYQRVDDEINLSPASPLDSNRNLVYRPASAKYVGVALGYKDVGFTIYFGVPASDETRAREGTSHYQDTLLSAYFENFGVDFHYTHYRGFIISNPEQLSANTLGGAPFYQLPDMESGGVGLNFYYSLAPEQFSMAAAFDQSQIQKNSGGSVVLIASIRTQEFENPNAVVPSENQKDFGMDQTIKKAQIFSIAPGVGYGHLWKLWGDFFVSPYLGVRVGYQSTTWDTMTTEQSHASLTVNGQGQFSMGWNSRLGFATINLLIDRYSHSTSSINISNSLQSATVSLGARFD